MCDTFGNGPAALVDNRWPNHDGRSDRSLIWKWWVPRGDIACQCRARKLHLRYVVVVVRLPVDRRSPLNRPSCATGLLDTMRCIPDAWESAFPDRPLTYWPLLDRWLKRFSVWYEAMRLPRWWYLRLTRPTGMPFHLHYHNPNWWPRSHFGETSLRIFCKYEWKNKRN